MPERSNIRGLNHECAGDDDLTGVQRCPTCGPTTAEPHPRRQNVTRCANCKEWLPAPIPDADPNGASA